MDKQEVVEIAMREFPDVPWNTISAMVLGTDHIEVRYRLDGTLLSKKSAPYTGEWPEYRQPPAYGEETS